MDYKQWFDQFQAQIGKEDPSDPTATFINLNRPEDRGRIFAMGDTAMENILPADGPITDAHKQQLFNLANDGKLFVFSLGSTDPIQADVKEGNLLRDLQFHPSDRGYMKNVQKPKPEEFSFLKLLLNKIFGVFKEERQRLENYNNKVDEYNKDLQVLRYVRFVTSPGCDFTYQREMSARIHNENFRANGRIALETTQNLLKDETLTPWRRSAAEAREKIIKGIVEGGTSFTKAEAKEMLVALVTDALLTKKTALAEVIKEHPEQLNDLRASVEASRCIAGMLQSNETNKGGMLAPCAFGDKLIGNMAAHYSAELRDRQCAANMLQKEGVLGAISNDLPGVKELFQNEQITQRAAQYDNARARIPQEALKSMVNGAVSYDDRLQIALDDPRVLDVINADKAAAANTQAPEVSKVPMS